MTSWCFRSFCLALWSAEYFLSARGLITAAQRESIGSIWGTEVANAWGRCDSAVTVCDVQGAAVNLIDASAAARSQFRSNPLGRYTSNVCNRFWEAAVDNMNQLSTDCRAILDWPTECSDLALTQNSKIQDPTFDLPVLCGIVGPGTDLERMPTCSTLVTATVANEITLTGCSEMEEEACIDHFCDVYATFHHRIRPRQMQEERGTVYLYPPDFVLPGCSNIADFDANTCKQRKDIHGFCTCLCQAMPELGGDPVLQCPDFVDRYFLFGRMGVEDVRVSQDCQDPMCQLMDLVSTSSDEKCNTLDLPSYAECFAMDLPRNTYACPWVEDSGENQILECMDGTRCHVEIDTWACCSLVHRGRARCPADLPVMCNTVCGGSENEYCCGTDCEERVCSPLLQPLPVLIPITTTTVTTTAAAPPKQEDDGFTLNIDLPAGWYIWLILLIGICCFCTCAYWFRRQSRKLDFEIVKPMHRLDPRMVQDVDKFGTWTVVKKPSPEDEVIEKIIVKLDVAELPQEHPLGLELQETTVVRVRPQGAKYGWKVGDEIIDVCGFPVATFEELWDRIQMERNRCPVTFLVQRSANDDDGEGKAETGGEKMRRELDELVQDSWDQPPDIIVEESVKSSPGRSASKDLPEQACALPYDIAWESQMEVPSTPHNARPQTSMTMVSGGSMSDRVSLETGGSGGGTWSISQRNKEHLIAVRDSPYMAFWKSNRAPPV
eukprot:CAMPEP_0178411956 /NCGR_PEP_ID=MMETSP0689_2-20121128/21762_1 /TAXON_ID=160604 /ORGANISM="Amphidinium massartii, Strain CS-259" /LENGTH=719 /DNA_ID=CAMNT_0020033179 /DNA_START=152 /DNA_END=2308 /DNA_ORIENTATION=+